MRRSSFPSRVATLAIGGLAIAGALLAAGPAMAATPGTLSIDFSGENFEMSAVSSDGATIALSSYNDSTITLIRTATNTAVTVADPDGDVNGPGGIVFSPDDSTIYVANYDGGNILVIDVQTATITSGLSDSDGVFDGPWVLARDLAGTTLYVGDYNTSNVHFFDIGTATVTDSVNISANTTGLYGLYASANASQLFAVDSDGSIDVINVVTATALDPWTDAVLGDSFGGCISPDRLSLYQPDANDTALYKSSLVNGDVLASNLATVQPQNSAHTSCAVSPDGASVFVSHYDALDPGAVTEYDATTLAYIATHDFAQVEYTQQIQFFSACRAYVVGYNGGAQTLDFDCAAAPAVPELADTGLDGQTVAITVGLSALLMSVGLLTLRRRHVRVERLATRR